MFIGCIIPSTVRRVIGKKIVCVCVCVCVCLFASGSKKHFFRENDFRAPDGKNSVFRVRKRFFEKIRLLRPQPPWGDGRGQKNIFFGKLIFLLRMVKISF